MNSNPYQKQYRDAIRDELKNRPTGLTAKMTMRIGTRFLRSVVPKDSAPVPIHVADLAALIFAPTESLKKQSLHDWLEANQCSNPGAAVELLTLQLNVVTFNEFLANTVDPDTKKPFITKQKRVSKKKAFAAIFSEDPNPQPS